MSPKKVDLIPEKVVFIPKKVDCFPETVDLHFSPLRPNSTPYTRKIAQKSLFSCTSRKKSVSLRRNCTINYLMSQKTFWKIQYINLCIDEFARKYRLAPKVAYNYLNKYKGLEFLNEHYEHEHTQALWETQESLRIVCQRNGGTI